MSSNADDTSPPPQQPPSPPPQPLPPPPQPHLSLSSSRHSPATTLREDCWSEEATHALIDAWGSRHLSLHRGNLRHHHWLEVSSAVNAAICAAAGGGSGSKLRRTEVQCKNRIDTLKKKYKIEKARYVTSSSSYVSQWPFFEKLHFFISGGNNNAAGDSVSPVRTPVPTKFPVGPRSAMPKRPRNFGAVAAVVEEREREEEGTTSSSGGSGSGGGGGGGRRERGWRELAEAIRRLGEVYERVEGMKQEQLIELEKHRMQFAKDLEFQRMKLLMDTQLQLARISGSNNDHDHNLNKRSKLSDDAVELQDSLLF